MKDPIPRLVADIPIPPMAQVKQSFEAGALNPRDIPQLLQEQLKAKFTSQIKPGMRIAVTAGSRGIANMPLITKTLVEFLQAAGAKPFIVPAMGSHGGANAQGQRQVLASYGFTQEYLGCPIQADISVHTIAEVEGHPLYLSRLAAEADGIIVCARIKPHTAFTGPVESGIMKMLVIGLGNDAGASYCHNLGYQHFARLIPLLGQGILHHAPVLGAVATVENAYDETRLLKVLKSAEIPHEEPLLLKKARAQMPRIYIEDYDVLIVDEIGKNISGAGMDPHITGSFATPYARGVKRPQNIAVLDVAEASNGNIIGIGQADVTTRRLMDKAILSEGYANGVVSNMLSTCKIPMILENDRLAIQVAIKCCEDIDRSRPRIIRIKNTLQMGEILISEALTEQVEAMDNLSFAGPFQAPAFDAQGNLF